MARDDRPLDPREACGPTPDRSPGGGGLRARLAGEGLYLVVTAPAVPHDELVAAAVERAVPLIQLREKDLSDRDLTTLAARLAGLTRESETLFIVNDRPDIAAEVGADGVHVGRSDIKPREARRMLGPDGIVGVTANTEGEALAARAAGADYVGVGPVFPTRTKTDAPQPVGLGRVGDLAKALGGFPIVAIGGIDRDTAASVLAAGADFVAVVSAVCRASDPVAAIDDLLAALGGSFRRR